MSPPTPLAPPAQYQTRPLSDFTTTVPLAKAKAYWFFPEAAAKLGVHLVAGPGAGKSRLLGRRLAWQVVQDKKPLVVLDPIGGTIDNLLDVIARLPQSWRRAVWSRITYIDVGARDYLTPTPLYYRLSEQESLFEIANRFPAILKRQDPELQSAPILGWNSLYECAISAGMIAAALGRQLDFVADLVLYPGRYKEELKQALAIDPTVRTAVEYFRALMDPTRNSLREKRTGSFITKLIPFVSDPLLLARFSGSGQGIDWEKVSQEGHTVLIDFRHVLDADQRQFAMLWYFKAFTDYIKHRGMAGRGSEITFIIDEMSQMLAQHASTGDSLLAADLEELVAVLARNYGVNVIMSHQNLSQLEPRIQNVLLQMGTQIIGRVAGEDALALAKAILEFQPLRVKKYETQWMPLKEGAAWALDPHGRNINGEPYHPMSDRTIPFPVDTKTTEYSAEEQYTMLSDVIRHHLDRFEFLVLPATAEGTVSSQVRRMTLKRFDTGQWPDEPYLASIRACLRYSCGVQVDQLLTEINQRRAPQHLEVPPSKPKKTKPKIDVPPRTNDKIGEQHAQASTDQNAVSTVSLHPEPTTGIATDIWNPLPHPPAE